MPGLWRGNCPLAARFRYYDGLTIHLRTLRMQKPKSFLRVFTESGPPLIALAVAVALLVGIVGPASAQFFNFGGPPPRPQPRSGGFGGGFGGGGGWFGGGLFTPIQQQGPQRVGRGDLSQAPSPEKTDTRAEP